MKQLQFTTYYVSYRGKQIDTFSDVTGPDDLDKRLGRNNWREDGNVIRIIRESHLPKSKKEST